MPPALQMLFLLVLEKIPVKENQVRDEQHTAAGDEAVGHIEHGKTHEFQLDHVHHVAKP